MKIPADLLIAALTHPDLYLSGDENGGVELLCRTHRDGGRPIAYYGDCYPDPGVATVATIPALWATAADHLATQHRET